MSWWDSKPWSDKLYFWTKEAFPSRDALDWNWNEVMSPTFSTESMFGCDGTVGAGELGGGDEGAAAGTGAAGGLAVGAGRDAGEEAGAGA